MVNYREIMAFPSEQRTKNASIVKYIPSTTDAGGYVHGGLLTFYNSRTTGYGKVSFEPNETQRSI